MGSIMNHRLEYGERGVCYRGAKIAADEHGAARWLLANGEALPDDTMTTWRGSMACLTRHVGWFAKRTVRETDKAGPTSVRWRPFPAVPVRSGMALPLTRLAEAPPATGARL